MSTEEQNRGASALYLHALWMVMRRFHGRLVMDPETEAIIHSYYLHLCFSSCDMSKYLL